MLNSPPGHFTKEKKGKNSSERHLLEEGLEFSVLKVVLLKVRGERRMTGGERERVTEIKR